MFNSALVFHLHNPRTDPAIRLTVAFHLSLGISGRDDTCENPSVNTGIRRRSRLDLIAFLV